MRIDVALLPSLIADTNSVFAVVDVLRASSTIVTLLDKGAQAVVPASSVDEARQLREQLPDHLLCGERGGLPPEGFDYGNSPAEFSALEMSDRSAILATSNGTRVLNQLSEAPGVLVGALLNREAVAGALLTVAEQRDCDVTIVCAAAPNGRSLALEDSLGAGAIAEAAMRLERSLQPSDAALFARGAFLSHRGDLEAALASARHGAELIAAGFQKDVERCACLDFSTVVPALDRDQNGFLTLRPHPTA